MGHPGGARNPSDPRFLSLFSVFEVQQPAGASLRAIYQAILSRHLATLPAAISEALGESLTDATMELYGFICERLPPTPSRFHYVFNLRDLSRVYEVSGRPVQPPNSGGQGKAGWAGLPAAAGLCGQHRRGDPDRPQKHPLPQGLLRSTPEAFTTPAQLLRLWRNELLRVFHDRLICAADKQLVTGRLAELLQQRYGQHAEPVLQDPLLFGDYRCAALLPCPATALPCRQSRRLCQRHPPCQPLPHLASTARPPPGWRWLHPRRAPCGATRTWAAGRRSRSWWWRCWRRTTRSGRRCSWCSSRTRWSTSRASCAR
jgi:hypothetical protein